MENESMEGMQRDDWQTAAQAAAAPGEKAAARAADVAPAVSRLERKLDAVVAGTSPIDRVRFVLACVSLLCALICFMYVKYGVALVAAGVGLLVFQSKRIPYNEQLSVIPLALFGARLVFSGALVWGVVYYGLIMQIVTYLLVVVYALYALKVFPSFSALDEIATVLLIVEAVYGLVCVCMGIASSMLGFIYSLCAFSLMCEYLIRVVSADPNGLIVKLITRVMSLRKPKA